MNSQSMAELARLNLPRPLGPRPEIPRAARAKPMAPAGAGAQLEARRRLLMALSGGVLGPAPQPQRVPHRPHQDPVLTLVHRITQGFNVNEYARAQTLGYEGYLEEQLDPASIDDALTDVRLATHHETLFLSPKQLYDTYSGDFTEPYQQFKGAMLMRSVNSRRQLLERMCEFWSDHFNIEHDKGDLEWALLPQHDLQVIRAHALGSFPAMLRACAFSPAMLFYLDNWLNFAGAPQENYSRELLELHTLGVHGGYSESDVDEVAKCFTGWTLNGDPSSAQWMQAQFVPELHSQGRKLVLGNVVVDHHVREIGQPIVSREAQQVIDLLAAHPSTAEFLARKLVRWFLTPTPSPELVARVAQTYLDTHGDIKSMLRVILARENLSGAAAVVQPKYRRPYHLMTSLYRALDGKVRRFLESLTHLESLGQVPYDFGPPTGYPDTVEAWGNLILPRWNFVAQIFSPYFVDAPDIDLILVADLKQRLEFVDASDRPGLAQRINERVLGEGLPPREVRIVQDFIDAYPATYDTHALFDTLALAASLPGYQWY